MKTARVSWSDRVFNWDSTKYALFRSTWDYFYRFGEFREWLSGPSTATELINERQLIEWNLDKHYLEDLSQQGVAVVPTHYSSSTNEPTSLGDIAAAKGWSDVVIKPTISGTAMDTYKIMQPDIPRQEQLFGQLCDKQVMMVQPLEQFILDEGEFSLVVIGGQFTHALRKVAKEGDFRVQSDFGGTAHAYEPTPEEIAFAEKAVATCNPVPAYARVDIIYENNGGIALVELELIEPELWFRRNPDAADLLAEVIANQIKK